MTASMRTGGAAAGLLSLVVLAGCGGSSGNSTTSGSGSSAVDPCIVNTWVSSKIEGSLQGQTAQISGGTGEKVTIDNDGNIQIDDSNVAPLNITAQGQSVQVKQSGQGSGKVTTTGGNKMQVNLSNTTITQQAFDATGTTPQGTPEPAPSTSNLTYTCSANQQLQLSQSQSSGGNQTVTYVPASSNGGGASSSGTDTGSSSSSNTSGSDTGSGSGSSSSDTSSSSSST